jgi:hypothetical protein
MYGKKMAYGGLTESKAKRPNDYDGNEKEANELEKELETENFAKGGMAKSKITAAHKKAKELMPEFQKEYGKEKGKQIAYATMMKQEKGMMGGGMVDKMADGGEVGKGKGAVMAIVARLAKKPMQMSKEMESEGEGEEMESGMGGMREAKMAAAEEVMSALKSGDKEMFAGALENFMRACGEYED